MNNVDLAESIRLTAAIIATIVAIGLPLGYWVLAYQFEAAAPQNTGVVALLALALAIGVYICLTVLPLRALERALAMLRHEQECLRVVVDNTADGIITLDPQGAVETFNFAAVRMFGCQPAEFIGQSIANIIPEFPLPAAGTTPGAHLRLDKRETVARSKDGATFPIELAVSQATLEGKPKLIVIVRGIAERTSAERNLAHLANYDNLTGLPNRSLFHDRLRQTTFRAVRSKRLVALLYLDLDQFKMVNDSLGHVVGDTVLKQVAQRVQEGVRRTDTVSRLEPEPAEHANVTISRLGGDEFSVILEDVDSVEHTAIVAQRILDAIARPFMVEAHEIFITASMGITVYPNDGTELDSLISGADAAMYQAKERRRNNFQFFTPDMGARAKQRLEFEAALRHALEHDEFSLHYQPKFDLGTGQVTGMEALLHWSHAEFGSTVKFIPILEDSGLIIPVGEWVLRNACAQVKNWQAKGLPALRVSVNISARQFQQQKLVASIAQILADTGLEPGLLEVEMTESLLMVHTEASIKVLTELKALGIHISVDDFGTGYSSLSYLKRFPVDVLKIDQSFVRDITADPDDAAIVRAIIALAQSLRLRTIAEGVETVAQLEYLRAQGCDEIQGYLLSRPLPPDAFEAWVATGRQGRDDNDARWFAGLETEDMRQSEG